MRIHLKRLKGVWDTEKLNRFQIRSRKNNNLWGENSSPYRPGAPARTCGEGLGAALKPRQPCRRLGCLPALGRPPGRPELRGAARAGGTPSLGTDRRVTFRPAVIYDQKGTSLYAEGNVISNIHPVRQNPYSLA